MRWIFLIRMHALKKKIGHRITTQKTIHNPLSKDLDDLDGGDADYNFSVYSKITNAEDSASAAMTENIPYAATNVA